MPHERYVALLRGINVGRAKRVAMADLRMLVEGLGFTEVRTLLNSGNVVFTGGAREPSSIAGAMEEAMGAKLGVDARVTVLTGAELASAAEGNPLRKVATDDARLLVAFLRVPAQRARLQPLAREDWSPEAFALGSRAAYLWCAEGILKSPLAQSVGRLLGEDVTTRNWATVTKLRALV